MSEEHRRSSFRIEARSLVCFDVRKSADVYRVVVEPVPVCGSKSFEQVLPEKPSFVRTLRTRKAALKAYAFMIFELTKVFQWRQ